MKKMRSNKNYEVVHPCLDNINGKLYLKVFRYMFNEPTLPKHRKAKELLTKDDEWAINAMSKSASEFQEDSDRKIVEYERSLKLRAQYRENPSFVQRIKNIFIKPDDPLKTMEAVKDDGVASETLSDKLSAAEEGIERLLRRAADASQTKLVDELLKHKKVVAGQIVLQQNGFDKYVQESSIVKFIKRSRKGVRLDFIRNYTQLIPLSVLETKKKADDLNVFDNYCVMYYDPEWESWGNGNVRFQEDEAAAIRTAARAKEQERILAEERRMKEERQRRRSSDWSRDPILFGMIEGSRRLYFVADWVTDDDDLTLEKLNIVVENATQYLEYYKHDIEEQSDVLMRQTLESMKNIKQDFVPAYAESAKD